MPAPSLLLFFLSFHELISSPVSLLTPRRFVPGRIRTFSLLVPDVPPSCQPTFSSSSSFAPPLHRFPSLPAGNDVLASLNLARVNADVIVIVSIRRAGRQGGARTQKWKKIERRSRRGNRSEETPGALCSARLLIAVNTIVRPMIGIALITRSRIRRYDRDSINSRRDDPRGLMIDNS